MGIALAANNCNKEEERIYQPVAAVTAVSPEAAIITNYQSSQAASRVFETAVRDVEQGLQESEEPTNPWCEERTREDFRHHLRGLCPDIPEGRTPRYLELNAVMIYVKATNCNSAVTVIENILFPNCPTNQPGGSQ